MRKQVHCQDPRDGKGTGHRIPIIAVTANTDKDIREACIAAGLDDYLDKDWKEKN